MEETKNGFAVASLVLGIISVCCCGGAIGLILGILAVVFAILAKKKPAKQGLAKAGLILGIIGLVLFVVVMIISHTEWYQDMVMQQMTDLLGEDFANMLQ